MKCHLFCGFKYSWPTYNFFKNSFLLLWKQEVDLLLNDGSKHINVAGWRQNATLPRRVETSRRRSRRCLLMSLALAKTSAQQVLLTFYFY